jgi:hypothetical protein
MPLFVIAFPHSLNFFVIDCFGICVVRLIACSLNSVVLSAPLLSMECQGVVNLFQQVLPSTAFKPMSLQTLYPLLLHCVLFQNSVPVHGLDYPGTPLQMPMPPELVTSMSEANASCRFNSWFLSFLTT